MVTVVLWPESGDQIRAPKTANLHTLKKVHRFAAKCLDIKVVTCVLSLAIAVSLITARVRSTREGTVFTGVCLLTSRGGGYPVQLMGGTPFPARQGGYPIQLMGGYPLPRSGWGGTPFPGPDGGVPPSQVQTGGSPFPGLDGGYPLPRSRWGVPPSQVWRGVPPQQGYPLLPYQHSVYLLRAGGMPLAFTQENFLHISFCSNFYHIRKLKQMLGKQNPKNTHQNLGNLTNCQFTVGSWQFRNFASVFSIKKLWPHVSSSALP